MIKPNFFGVMFLSIALIGCSSIDSKNVHSEVLAPSSISGQTIEFTINAGSGGFASTGTWTVEIFDTKNQYLVTGDTVNTSNTVGVYQYSANGNKGKIYFVDSAVGKGHLYLTYTSSTSGTYVADKLNHSSANHSGSFVEQKIIN